MVALTFHNFLSAAVGIAIAAALVRGIARQPATIGNFWVDLVRITYYLLLPICLGVRLFLVSQGIIQNFKPYTTAKLVEPQTIRSPRRTSGQSGFGCSGKSGHGRPDASRPVDRPGSVASQVAIKMLGTNGGGYFNANAAHPFENPTPLSNFFQMLSIFAIGSGLTYYLGRMTKNQRTAGRCGRAMMPCFWPASCCAGGRKRAGIPSISSSASPLADGNMEGKEVRFGIFNSALFATVTTDASCGAVNSMHDSFTPLGGLVPLFNIQLGEIIFGGVGAGLYGMLVFVVIAVFIAGLMVGRTPEYLGKKIQSYEVKMAAGLLPDHVAFMAFRWRSPPRSAGRAGRTERGEQHGLTDSARFSTRSRSGPGTTAAPSPASRANTSFYNTTGRHLDARRPIRAARGDHGAGGRARAEEEACRRAPARFRRTRRCSWASSSAS